jgi:alkylated DNA repair dioxygenase AlkB
MGDIGLVKQILHKLSLEDLLKCKEFVTSAVNHAYVQRRDETLSKNAVDFVKMEDSISYGTDTTLYAGLVADLESLDLKSSKSSVATTWLTNTGQPYAWDTGSGRQTIKAPRKIEDSRFIHDAMVEINSKLGVRMNSCLVSHYMNGQVAAGLHDDNEESLDQTQPICILSFGAERTVEFLHHCVDGRSRANYSITPADGSLYLMFPGCQHYFKHRVPKNKQCSGSRYSISFRCMKPDNCSSTNTNALPNITTPVKNLVMQFESGSLVNDSTNEIPTASDEPFMTPPSSPPIKKKRTTVLFGTSMTLNLEKRVSKLKGGRKFLNVSNWGAKIRDIKVHLQDFSDTHEAAGDVEKIIFSLGTNDIKFAKRGVNHLKRYVAELIDLAKHLFPDAITMFQCCLPIRVTYHYTVSNVLNFNKMLKSLCYDFNCVYVDCFKLFLSADERDHNRNLFYDWLHMNWNGKGILGNWLTHVINQNSYYNLVLDRKV